MFSFFPAPVSLLRRRSPPLSFLASPPSLQTNQIKQFSQPGPRSIDPLLLCFCTRFDLGPTHKVGRETGPIFIFTLTQQFDEERTADGRMDAGMLEYFIPGRTADSLSQSTVVVWCPFALSFLSVRPCWIMDEIGFENYTRWPLAGTGLALIMCDVVDLDVFVDLSALCWDRGCHSDTRSQDRRTLLDRAREVWVW